MATTRYVMYIDGDAVPLVPSEIKTKINSNDETITLVGGDAGQEGIQQNSGQVSVLKFPKLTDFSFSLTLPHTRYPFCYCPDGFHNQRFWLDKFDNLKKSMKPFQLIISREDISGNSLPYTNAKVSLSTYTINEKHSYGYDMVLDMDFKQYRSYGTTVYKVDKSAPGGNSNKLKPEKTREEAKAPSNSTYTVAKGDCLWSIAKSQYGDGSKWKTIYNANKNKIKNPNLIYAGQKLTIPR